MASSVSARCCRSTPMSFRAKLFLVFLATVLTSVVLVAGIVTHYTRAAFEDLDAQRTEALVAQFKKEYAQRGEEVAHQVENIANAEITLRMALDLARPNADQSLYVRDAMGAAQDHGLDFVEFVNSDGVLISSAQYPARVGYKNDWVTAGKDWRETGAFLKREELPDGVALSLSVVRMLPVGARNFSIIGGRGPDQKFFSLLVLPAGMRALLYRNLEPDFVSTSLTDAGGAVQQAERFAPIIEEIQKRPQPLVHTINWSQDAGEAETFHAMPLTSPNKELLGVLLVGSSRWELVLLTRRIGWIAGAVGGGALFIGLLLTWWVSARITRPVEELADGAREVASGNWDAHIRVRGGGEIAQLAKAFNEMTATLASQREELVQTERVAAWRELARRLAHELRNPLFPLQITVENLQRARQLDAKQFLEVFTEATATLKAELANLNTIVGRFSDFSKMPAPHFTRVNVNESLRSAVRLLEAQFNAVVTPVIAPEYFFTEPMPPLRPPLRPQPLLLRTDASPRTTLAEKSTSAAGRRRSQHSGVTFPGISPRWPRSDRLRQCRTRGRASSQRSLRLDSFRRGHAGKKRAGTPRRSQSRGSENADRADFRASQYRDGGQGDKAWRPGFSRETPFHG